MNVSVITPRAKEVPVPAGLARLPLDPVRGFHVPWFVAWIDGKPEWRVADRAKRFQAVRLKLCWVCGVSLPGENLSKRMSFLLGPMCCVNRISAEPPMHRECAVYSALVCPFLTRPAMERREGGRPEEARSPGIMIARNPGVGFVWDCHGFTTIGDGMGGALFKVHDPLKIEAYREGRVATAPEVEEAFASGLPILEETCKGDLEQLAELRVYADRARRVLGLAS